MFIKKRFIILGIILLLGAFIEGVFFYIHYQSLPEFALPLLDNMPEPAKTDRILVFAPHCDDETLGSGSYIARALKHGADVKVVIVINGDGHRFSTIEEFKKIYPSSQDYIKSGYTRQEESRRALSVLGLKNNIVFLGYPDGGLQSLLNRNWKSNYRSPYTKTETSPYEDTYRDGVSYQGVNLYDDISKLIIDYSPTSIVLPSIDDLHPDHEATSLFVEKVLSDNPSIKTNKYYYLVHYRRFPNPKGLRRDRYLTPPASLINFQTVWIRFDLDKSALELKEKALKEYKTQLAVPTLRTLMEGFLRQNELFYRSR